MHTTPPQITGIDISTAAVKLAQRNLVQNISKGYLPPSTSSHIQFLQGSIFAERPKWWEGTEYDVVVSNPPYISPHQFDRVTTRSVRNYEPKTALVPASADLNDEAVGDAFYPRIIAIARDTKAKLLVMEVEGMHQARRIIAMAGRSKRWENIEIWTDGVSNYPCSQTTTEHVEGHTVTIRGAGEGRAVAFWASVN
ncbi:MAG: hypothetical protein Q9168_001357 [Polycauliona sp. 1 TL-2023]